MNHVIFMISEIPVRVCSVSREPDVKCGFGARYTRSTKEGYSYGKALHTVLGNPGGFRLS